LNVRIPRLSRRHDDGSIRALKSIAAKKSASFGNPRADGLLLAVCHVFKVLQADSESVCVDQEAAAVTIDDTLSVPIKRCDGIEPAIQRLARIPIRLSVRLCCQSIPLRELVSLAPGDCLCFESAAIDGRAELVAAHRTLGTGAIMRKGDQLGLRLDQPVTGPQLPAT
jgi:flagellar motor switch/type III secretory pathway protein FliN